AECRVDFLLYALRGLLAAHEGDAAVALEQARLCAAHRLEIGHYHHAQDEIACIHTLLGDTVAALQALAAAAGNGYPCVAIFETDPLLDGLRGEAAFGALVARLR